MIAKKRVSRLFFSIILILAFCAGLLTACENDTQAKPDTPVIPEHPVVPRSSDKTEPVNEEPLYDPQESFDERMMKLQKEFEGTDILDNSFTIWFTHDYTVETLYHDFTPEDFREVEIDGDVREVRLNEVKEIRTYDTDWLRKKLAGEEVADYPLFIYSSYGRFFEAYLTEPGRENIFAAVIALSFRTGIYRVRPTPANIDWRPLETEVADPYVDYQWALEKNRGV